MKFFQLRCYILGISIIVFCLIGLASAPIAAERPNLLLANLYRSSIELDDYWVSEKLDGVRAYWDGQRLISRQGNVFRAPDWFTRDFPVLPLDGELWMGRGAFAELSGAVRKQQADAEQWRRIRFMVFDLPADDATFDQRLVRLQKTVGRSSSAYLQVVKQFKVAGRAELMSRLQSVVEGGGEGLMLHRGGSHYRGGRSDDLLKLKTYRDAEAVVMAHLPGAGKYRGMMGSLLVEMPSGLRFKIGTGFSDEERQSPPPVGSTITYKYYGLTENGIPRFASFLRVRGR